MPVSEVANPEGGAGKSTLAMNLAGWLATHDVLREVAPVALNLPQHPPGRPRPDPVRRGQWPR